MSMGHGGEEETGKPKKELSPKQKKEIHDVFLLFDQDGNGQISNKEFKHFLDALGHPTTQEEMNDMMLHIDQDKNGTLSEVEFIDFMSSKMSAMEEHESPEELTRALFAVFDKDNSGSITAQELRHTLQSLGTTLSEDDLHDFVKDFDESGEGHIDLEEFARVIKLHMKD